MSQRKGNVKLKGPAMFFQHLDSFYQVPLGSPVIDSHLLARGPICLCHNSMEIPQKPTVCDIQEYMCMNKIYMNMIVRENVLRMNFEEKSCIDTIELWVIRNEEHPGGGYYTLC